MIFHSRENVTMDKVWATIHSLRLPLQVPHTIA